VKALAKKPATTAQPAKSKASAPTKAEVAKSAAKASGKPVVSYPATDTARAVPKTVSKKPASPAPQPVAKPVTKSASPASAKVPAASKPAASAATKPAKAVAPPVAPAPPAPKAKTAATKAAAAKVQASVEPTPRPLGKRAAKKVMMEQMTQAEVVPTHAADAAKATFSSTNERVVMTPPVPSAIRKDPKRANNWKTMTVDQLVDEDVLAMPDDEYMSDLQLAYFRRKLSQLRADMLANAGETTEHLREDTVVVPDPADRATIEEEHALELRTRDRERKLLKKIEQAIARIDSGDYGYCDETGEAIGVGRLMARPTASLSLEAQQRRELKQKMFGD
jgi:DnaK suppressor protein